MDLFNNKLKNFSGLAPIFPLPNLVFFPRTFLPLHIFEPRYRKMIMDADSNEKMICMTLLKEGFEDNYQGKPSIHNVGCLGYMELNNGSGDGTSNILLSGLAKVSINEVPTNKDYRLAELNIISESEGDEDTNILKNKVFRGFERLSNQRGFPQIPKEFQKAIDFEMAVNFLASHLPIDVEEKQKMLELDDISLRAKILVQFMESSIGVEPIGGLGPIIPGDPRLN
tara:strand:- start:23678 stop:24355 length:678 start_codon:yes stop_codon:yes gene_type:complete